MRFRTAIPDPRSRVRCRPRSGRGRAVRMRPTAGRRGVRRLPAAAHGSGTRRLHSSESKRRAVRRHRKACVLLALPVDGRTGHLHDSDSTVPAVPWQGPAGSSGCQAILMAGAPSVVQYVDALHLRDSSGASCEPPRPARLCSPRLRGYPRRCVGRPHRPVRQRQVRDVRGGALGRLAVTVPPRPAAVPGGVTRRR